MIIKSPKQKLSTLQGTHTSEAWVTFLELGTILNVTFPLASRYGKKKTILFKVLSYFFLRSFSK